jgi:hypothetical protein
VKDDNPSDYGGQGAANDRSQPSCSPRTSHLDTVHIFLSYNHHHRIFDQFLEGADQFGAERAAIAGGRHTHDLRDLDLAASDDGVRRPEALYLPKERTSIEADAATVERTRPAMS